MKLYEILKEKGYDVSQEVKLIPRHYTHLCIYRGEKMRIAIEIGGGNDYIHKIEKLKADKFCIIPM